MMIVIFIVTQQNKVIGAYFKLIKQESLKVIYCDIAKEILWIGQ